jgi:hypothetical protein
MILSHGQARHSAETGLDLGAPSTDQQRPLPPPVSLCMSGAFKFRLALFSQPGKTRAASRFERWRATIMLLMTCKDGYETAKKFIEKSH